MSKSHSKAEETRQRVAAAIIPTDPAIDLDEFQMAKMLGVSVHKLRRDRWSGGGFPYFKYDGLVRYPRKDADATRARLLRRSTSDTGKVR